MNIDGNLSDTGNAKVPEGNLNVELLHEGEHEATNAGVDVTGNAVLGGQRGQLFHGVHGAVRIGVGVGHNHGCIGIDQFACGGHVGPEVLVQRNLHQLHAEVVAGLGVSGVR